MIKAIILASTLLVAAPGKNFIAEIRIERCSDEILVTNNPLAAMYVLTFAIGDITFDQLRALNKKHILGLPIVSMEKLCTSI